MNLRIVATPASAMLLCLMIAAAEPLTDRAVVRENTPPQVVDRSTPVGATDGATVSAGPCPGSGNCCLANGTPGCSNAACCEDVCFLDPFCCNTEWDSTCAGEAVQIGAFCCDGTGPCPGSGDCCSANGTPGCDDAACCETVCACDPFCCDVEWDASCAGNGFNGNGCGAQILCSCDVPSNDECTQATSVGEGSFPFNTTGATTSAPALPASCDEGFGLSFVNDIWYRYTPTCTGPVTVSLCGSSYDARMAAYSDSACPGSLVACNDDACGAAGSPSEIVLNVVAGQTHIIRIGGFAGGGSGTMTITCGNVCEPACNKTNVACLAAGPAFDNRRPVARLTREIAPGIFVPHCTGWMIGDPDVMMTNQHCVAGIDVTTLRAEFDYECDACHEGDCLPTVVYEVAGLIHADTGLDYALLDLAGNPAASFGTLAVSCDEVQIGAPIYEVHHAEGGKKGYDEGSIINVASPGSCLAGTDIEVEVSVIASQGASGSPIFNATTHAVEAICHCGPPCAAGWGVPMSAILPDALPHIENHGGSVSLAGSCATCPGERGCCWANGSTGCDDSACCALVCAANPSCCGGTWSAACVALAETMCAPLCHCTIFGDFDGDGDRDINDYVELFGCVTSPGVSPSNPDCLCGDSDADGDVDLIDVAAFQSASSSQ